jgi:cytochrome oxidase Cu insertion factor (SCO1/SenC/PrrC family)
LEHQFGEEIIVWENELQQKLVNKLYKVQKNFTDPRVEKLKNYRNRHSGTKYYYNREYKSIRIMTNRRFRRKSKKMLYKEHFYKLTPHDFKTYGWLTW